MPYSTPILATAIVAVLALPVAPCLGQQSTAQSPPAPAAVHQGAFVRYEALEMSMNRFRNFAGEVGYRFPTRHQVRLTVMEVDLTERHLASKWESGAVEGRGVTGYYRGYELHGDRFFHGNWYVSASVGYYADSYRHVTFPDRVSSRTMTVGSGIGYSRSDLFGLPHLSINFANPVRFYLNGIPETKLGDATVRAHKIVPNTWLFIGYQF